MGIARAARAFVAGHASRADGARCARSRVGGVARRMAGRPRLLEHHDELGRLRAQRRRLLAWPDYQAPEAAHRARSQRRGDDADVDGSGDVDDRSSVPRDANPPGAVISNS